MEVKALAKSQRISPRKLRLVAYAIKNMSIDQAYRVLEVTNKRASLIVQKTLKSAVANAVTNANLETNNLMIASITVNESQPFKRFRPSTRGRIHPYKKRGSHLTIVLKEKQVAAASLVSAKKAEESKEQKEEKKEDKK
jgi:large subunit ribosomal protein L22